MIEPQQASNAKPRTDTSAPAAVAGQSNAMPIADSGGAPRQANQTCAVPHPCVQRRRMAVTLPAAPAGPQQSDMPWRDGLIERAADATMPAMSSNAAKPLASYPSADGSGATARTSQRAPRTPR